MTENTTFQYNAPRQEKTSLSLSVIVMMQTERLNPPVGHVWMQRQMYTIIMCWGEVEGNFSNISS